MQFTESVIHYALQQNWEYELFFFLKTSNSIKLIGCQLIKSIRNDRSNTKNYKTKQHFIQHPKPA